VEELQVPKPWVDVMVMLPIFQLFLLLVAEVVALMLEKLVVQVEEQVEIQLYVEEQETLLLQIQHKEHQVVIMQDPPMEEPQVEVEH
tara:strand:+ start:94 stop:354 length:261 start_codon:yes stop_codon:yes gene_type:complete